MCRWSRRNPNPDVSGSMAYTPAECPAIAGAEATSGGKPVQILSTFVAARTAAHGREEKRRDDRVALAELVRAGKPGERLWRLLLSQRKQRPAIRGGCRTNIGRIVAITRPRSRIPHCGF